MDLAELTKTYDFTGKTVFVTGGTGVLCSVMARALVACGGNVAILARNPDKAASVAASMSGPGQVVIVAGDVLEKETVERAVEEVTSRFGKIDGLINGAGGNNPQATTRPDLSFFDLPIERLRQVLDLNLLGTIV